MCEIIKFPGSRPAVRDGTRFDFMNVQQETRYRYARKLLNEAIDEMTAAGAFNEASWIEAAVTQIDMNRR